MLKSHDLLSLDLIRNTLSSLTQLGLIRQPERWVGGDSVLPLSLALVGVCIISVVRWMVGIDW